MGSLQLDADTDVLTGPSTWMESEPAMENMTMELPIFVVMALNTFKIISNKLKIEKGSATSG